MILTPFLDLDQAYTTWLELRNVRYPESMDCWVEYVMSESWRHGDCHRHSMACGDGHRCRNAALVAIDAVLFWQEKRPAEQREEQPRVSNEMVERIVRAAHLRHEIWNGLRSVKCPDEETCVQFTRSLEAALLAIQGGDR